MSQNGTSRQEVFPKGFLFFVPLWEINITGIINGMAVTIMIEDNEKSNAAAGNSGKPFAISLSCIYGNGQILDIGNSG